MKQLTFNFAEEINRVHADAMALASEAKAHIAGAVRKAVECGQLMLKQKEALANGDGAGWIEWLTANCPDIPEQTARRYIQLAKNAPAIGNPEDDQSTLRQTYLATGLLGESPKPERQPDTTKGWVKFVKPLDQFRLWFNTRRDDQPVEEWGEDALRILSNELQWFVNLHGEIQTARQTLAKKESERL